MESPLLAGQELGLQPMPELPRRGQLEEYLSNYAEDASEYIAGDFYDAARPLASTVALIPVAAHQDSDKIIPALREYARQEGAEPFTICLLLNYPFDAPGASAHQAEAQVEAARKLFPALDIRTSTMSYDEPTIGQIRKDLWDAALRLALWDGLYDAPGSEVIGLNHDIDTESMSPHYMRNVQRYYRQEQTMLELAGKGEALLPARHTQVKHAYPFQTHPNVARAIFWSDLTYRRLYRGGVFSNGLAIPFARYAKRHGFDGRAVFHECDAFVPNDFGGIPGTGLETSPRRYIERIGTDSQAEIWTRATFGSMDACRDPSALPTDITKPALEARIRHSLDDDLRKYWTGQPQLWLGDIIETRVQQVLEDEHYDDIRYMVEVKRRIDARLQVARFALERVVEAPRLAGVLDRFQVNALTHRAARQVRLLAEVEANRLRDERAA